MALSAESTRWAESLPEAQGMIAALGDRLARALALEALLSAGTVEARKSAKMQKK